MRNPLINFQDLAMQVKNVMHFQALLYNYKIDNLKFVRNKIISNFSIIVCMVNVYSLPSLNSSHIST